MSNLVIAAIPAADDYVWKLSSEEIPHITLLYLGEASGKPINDIVGYVQHAVSILDQGPFMLEVDHRGVLGDLQADVLFFKDNWSLKKLAGFRHALLQDSKIRSAFDESDQFFEYPDGWKPHLTMGYPRTPAREDKRDYPGMRWIDFDRIAVWYGDYEGPEFRLEYGNDIAEVAMSDTSTAGAEFLAHFGVKGMRWGVRTSREARVAQVEAANRAARPAKPTSATDSIGATSKKKTTIKTKGGEDHPAAEDAVKVAMVRQKLNKSGMNALSNKELQDVAQRLNLEQQVQRLAPARQTVGQKFVAKVLADPAGSYATGKSAYDMAQPFLNKKR